MPPKIPSGASRKKEAAGSAGASPAASDYGAVVSTGSVAKAGTPGGGEAGTPRGSRIGVFKERVPYFILGRNDAIVPKRRRGGAFTSSGTPRFLPNGVVLDCNCWTLAMDFVLLRGLSKGMSFSDMSKCPIFAGLNIQGLKERASLLARDRKTNKVVSARFNSLLETLPTDTAESRSSPGYINMSSCEVPWSDTEDAILMHQLNKQLPLAIANKASIDLAPAYVQFHGSFAPTRLPRDLIARACELIGDGMMVQTISSVSSSNAAAPASLGPTVSGAAAFNPAIRGILEDHRRISGQNSLGRDSIDRQTGPSSPMQSSSNLAFDEADAAAADAAGVAGSIAVPVSQSSFQSFGACRSALDWAGNAKFVLRGQGYRKYGFEYPSTIGNSSECGIDLTTAGVGDEDLLIRITVASSVKLERDDGSHGSSQNIPTVVELELVSGGSSCPVSVNGTQLTAGSGARSVIQVQADVDTLISIEGVDFILEFYQKTEWH